MATEESGATMLAATTVLRGHKARIGKIGGNITLPRAVEIQTIAAVAAGMFVGLVAVLIIHPAMQSFLYGATFGGAIGYFVVNYSPLQGESMLKWMGLALNTKRQQIKIDGQPVRLAIGTAHISDPARGAVRIARGAVTVPPTQFDERGVQITSRNLNTPQQLAMRGKNSKAIAAQARNAPVTPGVPLPASAELSLETKAGRAAAAAAAGKGPSPESQKAGRLAAARAAQEAAGGQGFDGPPPPSWNSRRSQAATEVVDPFGTPAQHLPEQGKSSKKQPKVPAQGGPREVQDPPAGKPKKLPR